MFYNIFLNYYIGHTIRQKRCKDAPSGKGTSLLNILWLLRISPYP